MQNTKVSELKSKLDQGEHLLIIDVRTPAEFEEEHLSGAVNIPLGVLNQERLERIAATTNNLFFICHSGGRSSQASQKISNLGRWHVFNILGGTNAAKEAGLQMTVGVRTIMSIERQVRVIAGLLVLLGVVLGLLLSPYFFYLSGAVGAGLIFAGISNFCGMALLLEKCPWNQSNTKCER